MDPRIIAVGDNVVDCYPQQARMFPGGNCVNVAVFAARFGAQSAYIGAIADDAAGNLLRNSLTAERVNVERLRTAEGFTAYCVIGNVNGDRVFLSSDKGVSVFEPTAADLEFVAGYDVVHVGSSSGLDSSLETLAARARLSYDFAVKRDTTHIATVGPLCYLASFSGGDLTAHEVADLLSHSVNSGARWTLVTRGNQGAVLTDGSNTFRCTATSVDVVDTLGAGDTFTARVLVGLLRGEEPGSLLEAASIAAATTCTQPGAFGFETDLQLPIHTNA